MTTLPSDGYEIQNPEIQQLLRSLAEKLGSEMPEGWGFTLLLFSYGEGGDLFYISSARTEDMLKTMTEFVTRRAS